MKFQFFSPGYSFFFFIIFRIPVLKLMIKDLSRLVSG
jgi:hypothetical protein